MATPLRCNGLLLQLTLATNRYIGGLLSRDNQHLGCRTDCRRLTTDWRSTAIQHFESIPPVHSSNRWMSLVVVRSHIHVSSIWTGETSHLRGNMLLRSSKNTTTSFIKLAVILKLSSKLPKKNFQHLTNTYKQLTNMLSTSLSKIAALLSPHGASMPATLTFSLRLAKLYLIVPNVSRQTAWPMHPQCASLSWYA